MGAQLVITAPDTHTSPHHQQGIAALVAQLDAMFGDQQGWLETWHGHSDPSTPARIILDKEPATRWHWYTRARRPELVRRLLDWGRQYGNVYISTTLYERPERSRQWALPSRVIFLDDAPEHAPLAYSMAVETSAGNRQASYLLAEAVDAATRQDLQRRIACALHADKSGADPEQLGRVAGTWNTKHSAPHPVTLSYADGPRYSVDELAARYAPVAYTPAGVASLATPDIERWLGNIDELLGADGLPRRLKNPQGQARCVLAGEMHMPSSSDDRACVCRGLVMHGYPDAEIAALLIHFCDYGAIERKGSAWLYQDIGRLIAKERARQPHITPTPSGAPRPHAPAALPQVPRKSRARQDRPQRITDEQYLAWCLATMDAGRQVKMIRKEIAAMHGISVPTVDRIEARLRERGALERFTSADRRRSWLAVYAAPMMIAPSPEVDAAAAEVPPEVLSGPQRTIDAPAHVGETHRPEQTPEASPPDPEPQAAAATFPALADAMREAFDAWSGARITQRRIAGYLEANYPGAPWSDGALCYWYGRVMEQRRRDRNREKLRADLPTMPQAKLRRLEKRCDRLLQDGPDGPHGKQYRFACWAAPLVADELQRPERLAALERVKPGRGRRSAPVMPPVAPLLALVDEAKHATKIHISALIPVHTGDRVTVPQEAPQPAQDGPSAADAVETPCTPDTPMNACAGAPELQDEIEARAPLGAVCSSLPAGPTVSMVPEPAREVMPAAAATCSQTIIRPDLYARLAAQRRAAAVYAIAGA